MSPARHHDAVIFDLDGTLVDTERLMYEAGEEVFARHGQQMTPALFARILGTDGPTGTRILGEALPEADLPGLMHDWDHAIRARFALGIPAKPGAAALLTELRDRGIPVAVATSSGRPGARRKLEASGLARFFDVVVTADDVTRRKPAPEPYLLAAARLGAAPERCLAFEDSAPGATAALAAGMTVVLVPDMAEIDGVAVQHVARDLDDGARRAGLW